MWSNRPDLGPSWQHSVFNIGQTHNKQKRYIGCSGRTLDPCPTSGPNKFPHSAPFLILRISSAPHVYVRQFLDFLEPKNSDFRPGVCLCNGKQWRRGHHSFRASGSESKRRINSGHHVSQSAECCVNQLSRQDRSGFDVGFLKTGARADERLLAI